MSSKFRLLIVMFLAFAAFAVNFPSNLAVAQDAEASEATEDAVATETPAEPAADANSPARKQYDEVFGQ